MSGETQAKTMRVHQVRSGIAANRRQKATLRAMGLGRVGHARVLADNAQTRGMVAHVAHLVRVEAGS